MQNLIHFFVETNFYFETNIDACSNSLPIVFLSRQFPLFIKTEFEEFFTPRSSNS